MRGPVPPDADGPGADHVHLDLRVLRAIGGAMLAMAAVLPFLPVPDVVLCPLRRVTGVPCPFCGMTRSVTALVHGDLTASLIWNPGGVLLVALAVALLLTWRWVRVAVPTWSVVAFFALLWAYQLFKYTNGQPL